ncbi:unnamed protein product [Moneuplotes crassus]|uniref:Uncharacterized protein n=1 Tax=Euplotes crassus TaxID=5936 RepID=A0AAD1XLR2_EUPCR|nr:unnamed protein product [Moneuplotes crassus]
MENKGSIEGCERYVTMMIIYSCFGLLILLFQLWYSVKFFKIYRFKHKLTSIFMVFLTLSIICDIIYGVSQVWLRHVDSCNGNAHSCADYWTDWINYFMYMSTIIVLSFTYISQILRFKNRGRSKKRIYNIILWTSMLAILLICAIIFIADGIHECAKSDPPVLFTIGIQIATGIYMLTGIFFMVTLLYFYRVLKRVDTDTNTNGVRLYKKLKCRLFVSITVIFVVFEIRSGMILARSFYDFLASWKEDSMKDNDLRYVIYIFCYYCLLSLVPAIVQIYLIKLSLSSTPRISIRLGQDYFQSQPLLSGNFEVSRSLTSESRQSVNIMELDHNTS